MIKKLTLRDKAILAVLVLAVVVFVGYSYLYVPATKSIDGLDEQISELRGKDFTHLDGKLQALETENTSGTKTISEIKEIEMGNSFDSQTFLIFLSGICGENGIDLVKFNDLGQSGKDEVWKQRYDFELRGSISNINKIVESIDELGVKYSVSSMSLRQYNDYPFLERFFDGISKLEWYVDPIPELERREDNPKISELLELSSFTRTPRVMFLSTHEQGDILRLNITIEFTMYSIPATGSVIEIEIL